MRLTYKNTFFLEKQRERDHFLWSGATGYLRGERRKGGREGCLYWSVILLSTLQLKWLEYLLENLRVRVQSKSKSWWFLKGGNVAIASASSIVWEASSSRRVRYDAIYKKRNSMCGSHLLRLMSSLSSKQQQSDVTYKIQQVNHNVFYSPVWKGNCYKLSPPSLHDKSNVKSENKW